MRPFERGALREKRGRLLSLAEGRTLEIGSGIGANFGLYPPGLEITAIEPDAGMRGRSLEAGAPGALRVLEADAQELPFVDEEFDTVIATLVFCCIPDPSRAGREVSRVLKPGGKFLLFEHVAKDDSRTARRIQDALTPAWSRIAGGCHLNRRVEDWLPPATYKEVRRERIWRGWGDLRVLQKL